MDNIALVFIKKGEIKKAIGYYLKALDIKQCSLGKNHKECALSLHNLAYAYYKLG